MFLPKMFLHIFHTRRSKYRRVLVKCCTKEILCTHRFCKIRENIAQWPSYLTVCSDDGAARFTLVRKVTFIADDAVWLRFMQHVTQSSQVLFAQLAKHLNITNLRHGGHCTCNEILN